MNISFEFLQALVSTGFSSIIYLIVAKILESYISPVIANGIGILLDTSLDFVFQSIIFMNGISLDRWDILTKFILSNVIAASVQQILFIIYYKYYRIKNLDNTYIRTLIGVFVFIFIVFPINKYYVFIN